MKFIIYALKNKELFTKTYNMCRNMQNKFKAMVNL